MTHGIHPIGDRLLVKLIKETEKKVGATVLTLAQDLKKRTQPECGMAMVIATGPDLPVELREGDLVLIRSDAGTGLTAEVIASPEARYYRLIEYPELLAKVIKAAHHVEAAQLQEVS